MANPLFSHPPNTSSTVQCLKYVLYSMFLLILVGGFAVLGIGIWTQTTEYGGRQLSNLIGAHLYLIDSYLFIICGCTILLITVLGFCGTFHENKCMLELHLCIMAFLSITLVVGGGLGFAFRDELEVGVREKLVNSLIEGYGVDVHSNPSNAEVTKTWNAVQRSFKCCGAHGDVNSTTSWALYKTQSHWYTEGNNINNSYVPRSCCKSNTNISVCVGMISNDTPPSVGPPVMQKQALNLNLYTVGCYDRMVETLEANGLVIGVTAITVATFMFVELVVCICLYRHLHYGRRRALSQFFKWTRSESMPASDSWSPNPIT
ncbi:CD151 antigen-like [Liolophura sinensis]|uniref:CD151 antigen-like n=1 Tax=Liolophura sinensis TaxID=3198878 RepID=UPI0031592FBC